MRWLKFENFLADMGPRPSTAHQLDRINNDGNYEPGNCRWVLAEDQLYNKRNTFRLTAFGEHMTLDVASARFGLSRMLIWQRICKGGMTPERALTQPKK